MNDNIIALPLPITLSAALGSGLDIPTDPTASIPHANIPTDKARIIAPEKRVEAEPKEITRVEKLVNGTVIERF